MWKKNSRRSNHEQADGLERRHGLTTVMWVDSVFQIRQFKIDEIMEQGATDVEEK